MQRPFCADDGASRTRTQRQLLERKKKDQNLSDCCLVSHCLKLFGTNSFVTAEKPFNVCRKCTDRYAGVKDQVHRLRRGHQDSPRLVMEESGVRSESCHSQVKKPTSGHDSTFVRSIPTPKVKLKKTLRPPFSGSHQLHKPSEAVTLMRAQSVLKCER